MTALPEVPLMACTRQVLISHADPVIRFGLAATLERSGYQGEILSRTPQDDGTTDLDTDVGIVVTDYQHGIQLCTRLREAGAERGKGAAGTKVMVVSNRDREHEIRSAIDAGVTGYLLSGFELGEFLDGMRALSEGSRYFCSAAASKMVDSMSREALTARELQVLRCLVDGYVNKRICDELNIALGTVKAHVKSIFSKFGVVTRTQAVCVATERGIFAGPNVANSMKPATRPVRHENEGQALATRFGRAEYRHRNAAEFVSAV